MKRIEQHEQLDAQYVIINDRKAKLRDMDYIGVKIAMGAAKKSDYSDEIAQCQQWRDDINAAEAEIERLKAITEFDDDEPELADIEPIEPEAL
jgi:hypothetical protein